MPNPLTHTERERMRELESEVTAGPWRWAVNLKHRTVLLDGPSRKMLETIMDFARWGMGSATPRFRNSSGLMEKAEVWAAPVEGREHHESWHRRITHPDAVFIEEARTFIPRALAALDAADAERESLGKLLGAAKAYMKGDPQVRGALFRDLDSTVQQIDDPAFDDYGWPRVVRRMDDLLVAARKERDARDELLREVLRTMTNNPDPKLLSSRIRALLEDGE